MMKRVAQAASRLAKQTPPLGIALGVGAGCVLAWRYACARRPGGQDTGYVTVAHAEEAFGTGIEGAIEQPTSSGSSYQSSRAVSRQSSLPGSELSDAIASSVTETTSEPSETHEQDGEALGTEELFATDPAPDSCACASSASSEQETEQPTEASKQAHESPAPEVCSIRVMPSRNWDPSRAALPRPKRTRVSSRARRAGKSYKRTHVKQTVTKAKRTLTKISKQVSAVQAGTEPAHTDTAEQVDDTHERLLSALAEFDTFDTQLLRKYKAKKSLGGNASNKCTVYNMPEYGGQVVVKVCSVSACEDLQTFANEVCAHARVRGLELFVPLLAAHWDRKAGKGYLVTRKMEGDMWKWVSIRDLSVYGFDMRNLKYAITLCDALTQLHELDLVHLDLKPGNLFYDGDKLCIGDFGCTTAAHSDTPRSFPGGTPTYMPMEMAKLYLASDDALGDYGPSTDYYSLAVIVHQLLTGRLPLLYQGKQLDEPEPGKQCEAVRDGHVTVAVDTRLPEPLWHLLTAMLSHDPRARPHPLELRAMLQLCLQQTEYEIMQETLMQQQYYDTAYYGDMGAHTQMLEAF